MIPLHRRLLFAHAVLLGCFPPLIVAAQDRPAEDADKRFDRLLAAAKAKPEKADWVKLRRAFAETSRYQPYNGEWRKELDQVRTDLRGENPKAAEAALDTLMEREGYMRLDAHGLAAAHYRRTGQKAKEAFHTQFARCIASAIYVPGTGTSFEKPIEVLWIEEEYLFFESLKMKAKRQRLVMHKGHKFDVFEVEAEDEGEPETFYFNVDLPQKSLGRMLERVMKKKGEK